MIKKKYYRITELEKKFGISEDDAQYLIEQGEVPLVFFRPNESFILGTEEDHKFIAHCYITYGGLIRLNKVFHLDFLLQHGFTLSSKAIPIEFNNIDDVDPIQIPNLIGVDGEIHRWDVKDLHEFENEPLFILENSKPTVVEKGQNPPPRGALFPRDDGAHFHLTFPHYKYQLQDIVFEEKTINKLGLVTTKKQPETNYSPINSLVAHLMQLHPHKGAAQIWNLLYENWEHDDDLDPESILVNMTREKLTYTKTSNIEVEIGKKRFRNIVSELKNS